MIPRVLALLCLLTVFPAFALQKQLAAEFHARREALAKASNGGAALLFGNDEPTEEYLSSRQNDDFYYLTGWSEPGAARFIEAADGKFVDFIAALPHTADEVEAAMRLERKQTC